MAASSKKLVIGVDEAGYGPNLGPLCLGISIWTTPSKLEIDRLAEMLHPCFKPKAAEKKLSWIPLGDSKVLYKSGGSISSLATGLHSMVRLSEVPRELSLRSLAPILCSSDQGRLEAIPWYQTSEPKRDDLEPDLEERLEEAVLPRSKARLRELDLRLEAIGARAIDEAEFNRLLDVHGNKSSLLSMVTLEWVRDWIGEMRASKLRSRIESVEVFCDKHGGRNRYQAPLTQVFPDTWFSPTLESASCSQYEGTIGGWPTHWSFTAKGDAIVPTSIASMAAKWTREVFMERWNTYWRQHIPDIRPTAGYPTDAKRFGNEIESIAQRLGFDRARWWRRL